MAVERSRRAPRGAVLIWVTIMLVLLVGFATLAVDVGLLFATQANLQGAADAAALAAAVDVDDGPYARAVAVEFAAKNLDPTVHGEVLVPADVLVGHWDPATGTFSTDADVTNAVRVTARRADVNGNPLGLAFARALGFTEQDVSATAIATFEPLGGDVIIILNPSESCALRVHGSVYLDIPHASIQVNSTNAEAFCVRGTVAGTNAPAVNVGSDEHIETGNSNFDSIMRRGVPSATDPLADLPAPPWSAGLDLGEWRQTESDVTTRLLPGYYSGGISALGGSIDLAPGIYVLDGEGLRIRGGSSLFAEGVMLYLTGSGVVDLRSSGIIRITPPDPALNWFEGADTYEGVSIFQARDNHNTSTIYGSSAMEMEGRFYFPAAHLDLGGAGSGFIGNQFIADTMEVFGTGALMIPYDEQPDGRGIIRLVE